ncbi:MAG TPA: hypothetical protein VKA53_01245, partial [Thermoanaerobaculia bacterium]|nr:hypothetical protein [Thermoanaerobaculia bacterium]
MLKRLWIFALLLAVTSLFVTCAGIQKNDATKVADQLQRDIDSAAPAPSVSGPQNAGADQVTRSSSETGAAGSEARSEQWPPAKLLASAPRPSKLH